MNFTNKTFTDESVNLDSNSFQGCKFVRCKLIYSGGICSLIDNQFDAPRFEFRGPAENTLKFMTALYHGGGQELVEGTFDNIRRGVLLTHPDKDSGASPN